MPFVSLPLLLDLLTSALAEARTSIAGYNERKFQYERDLAQLALALVRDWGQHSKQQPHREHSVW